MLKKYLKASDRQNLSENGRSNIDVAFDTKKSE